MGDEQQCRLASAPGESRSPSAPIEQNVHTASPRVVPVLLRHLIAAGVVSYSISLFVTVGWLSNHKPPIDIPPSPEIQCGAVVAMLAGCGRGNP